MTDLATLGIVIDSTQAKGAAGDLDRLAASGARAEAATVGLGRGTKSASASAAAYAASVQASARSTAGLARGAGTASLAMQSLGTKTHASSIQIRESLVLMREASVGNFTRMAGSASILAGSLATTGSNVGALAKQLLTMIGVLKVTQNAELAEAATQAAASAASIQGYAQRAAAAIAAADTELAFAEAAARVATTSEAEEAAQLQLAAAHEAVAAAAAEATIAEDALAVAQGRAAEAGAASAAATTVGLGTLGTALAIAAAIALPLALALEGVKQAADDIDPSAQQLISTLGLTDKEIKKLKDTTITWGDVGKATFQVLAEKAGIDAAAIKSFFSSAFHSIGEFGKFSVAIIIAAFAAGFVAIRDTWKNLPGIIGEAAVGAANLAVAAIEKLANLGIGAINKMSATINSSIIGEGIKKAFGVELPTLASVSLGRIQNQFSGTFAKIGANISSTFHGTFNAVEATFDEISQRASQLRDDRVNAQANAIIADRTNKAAKAHHERAKAAKEEADALENLNDKLAQLMALEMKVDTGAKLPSHVPGGLSEADIERLLPKVDMDTLLAGPREMLSLLQQISAQAQTTAQAMSSAFGPVGAVFGGIVSNIADYRTAQQQLSIEVLQGSKTQAQADSQLADLRHRNISATLAGLKGLFKEHSAGYKVMSAIEKAYALFQAVQTAIAIARDIAHTVSSVANSAVRTTANTAEGGSKIFAQLGMWAFPVVAAMVAVLASLGARGGGGGGAAPTSAEDVQKAQGAGTVLGSPNAQSESIANSLELVAANTNKSLEYFNPMLQSLRAIETNIGALAAQVAKELQLGGAFDTTGKLGTTSKGIQGLFGSTTTKSLYDQGLQFNPTALSDAIANGISGSTYQIIEKVKKSSGFLGIGGGTKTSYSTTAGALDPDLERQVGLILGSLRDSVVQAAKVLGIDVSAALNTFQVEIGKISFKDMSADEISKALEAVFSKVADQMAGFAVAGLEQFQKAGEGLFETLTRLAKDYTTIDVALKSIGKTFGAVGAASIAARENLIALFGSLENFVDQTAFYQQNFLTDAQSIAPIEAQVKATLASLGLSSVDTIAKFNQVVQGIDLTTDAGQQLYASLMALAPAFYQVEQYQAQQAAAAAALAKQKAQMEITLLQAQGKATEALAKQRAMELAALDPSLRALQQQIYTAQDIASAKDKLSQAYQRERSELEATISKFGDLSKSLREYRDTLFGGPTGGATYNSALAKVIATGSLASTGDATALGDLQGVSKSFLDVAKDRAGSLQQYQRDVALVARYVDQGITAADGQVSLAQKQLDTMTAQVSKLIDINASVLSVKDAILALNKLLKPTPAPAPTPTQGGGTHTGTGRQGGFQGSFSDRIDELIAISRQMATSTSRTDRTLRSWDRGGSQAVSTDSDTPLATTPA